MESIFLEKLTSAKLRLLKMHFDSNSGHIGGNLSCLDALMTLYHFVMKPDDRFILSKGHSAGALYVTLWSIGKLSEADLLTFSKDDSLLPGHPSGTGIPGLLFPTGSLGHGPSLSAGVALSLKYRNIENQVFCLCSDGEWQEGSCWEALAFSVHHKLGNLTIMIDQNGLQGFGHTVDISCCGDLPSKISSFGANVQIVSGHNYSDILESLKNRSEDKPNVLILNTIKGKGTCFEGKMESHYLPLTERQYYSACEYISEDSSS